MERRNVGSTELNVSRVGLGGIPIQRNGVSEAIELIDFLEEKGVNFIDTARGYTCSEEYIGLALQNRRDKFILATKSMARTYEGMKKDILISLNNLKTSYIDLYQIHNLKYEEEFKLVMSENGAYRALVEAKDQGLIKYIGITSHSFDFLDKVLDMDLFETIQFPYNIVESKNSILFEKAHKKGVGTICMKPLAGGAIDDGKLAIKYLLNDENVDVIIPGMKSLIEAEENLSIGFLEYTEEELNKIEEIKKKLDGDFCRRCGYCAPCTKGIDVASCFMFHGYYERYDLKDWAISRYNNMSAHASDCINCGVCLTRCPYEINIPLKLKEVVKSFGK